MINIKIMSNANEPAFAAINELGGHYQAGLTKREYFAGLAMQGLIANDWSHYKHEDPECEHLSKVAVNYADALLKELEKNQS